jgi:hypothetical protein
MSMFLKSGEWWIDCQPDGEYGKEIRRRIGPNRWDADEERLLECHF